MTSAFPTLQRKAITAIGLAKREPRVLSRLIVLNLGTVLAPIRALASRHFAGLGRKLSRERNYRDLLVSCLQKDIRDIRRSPTAR